jgi:hypothetical protein
MLSLYTAVGRFERRADKNGQYPVIIINRKEHAVDLPEMIIWTCCSWRILDISRLEKLFAPMAADAGIDGADFKGCVKRLLQQGLIVEGIGDNGDEALYDLLNSLYIIPVTSSIFVKAAAFLKFIFINKMPFSKAKEVFRKESLSDSEKRVVGLAKQTHLSTAELIKCVECGVYDLSNDDKVMTALYNDDFTTCDNIGSYAKLFRHRRPVLETVANLYLQKLIIFERI